jgi:hypothetical protein
MKSEPTTTEKILSRIAIRATAQKLMYPCLIEPDINQAFERPRAIISTGRFLQRRKPLIGMDTKDDSEYYMMLVEPKRAKR